MRAIAVSVALAALARVGTFCQSAGNQSKHNLPSGYDTALAFAWRRFMPNYRFAIVQVSVADYAFG